MDEHIVWHSSFVAKLCEDDIITAISHYVVLVDFDDIARTSIAERTEHTVVDACRNLLRDVIQ